MRSLLAPNPVLRQFLRFIVFICLLALGASALGGCVAIHSYKTVQFHLLDAESDHPVPNATIGIAYHGMGGMIPENVSGATDLNGLLDLRVARDNFAYIGIEADGYLRDPTNPELLDPPDKIELRVYRLPLPYHVLVVPAGTRGLLEARVTGGNSSRVGTSGKPPFNGKRAYCTRLSASSAVSLPPLLRLGEPFSDYDRILAAKSDDGRELPFWYPSRQIDSPDVVLPEDHRRHGPQPLAGDTFGLWFIGQAPLGWQASRMFFYAGTLQKARAAQDRLKAQWQHDSPAHPTIWTPGLPPAQK